MNNYGYVTARFATSGPFQSWLARFEAVRPGSKRASYKLARYTTAFVSLHPRF